MNYGKMVLILTIGTGAFAQVQITLKELKMSSDARLMSLMNQKGILIISFIY